MMRYALRVVEETGIRLDDDPRSAVGLYVKVFDPDAADGRGFADFTANPNDALMFPDQAAAMACWRTQSRVRPLRDDGMPNRPLTALTVEIVQVQAP